jgi:hypothetical protein
MSKSEEGAMDKGKKKDYTGKILSKIQNRLQLLEFLDFLESIKRFKPINGREPTGDEIKNMAKTLHVNLYDLCAFLEKISSNKFPMANA